MRQLRLEDAVGDGNAQEIQVRTGEQLWQREASHPQITQKSLGNLWMLLVKCFADVASSPDIQRRQLSRSRRLLSSSQIS